MAMAECTPSSVGWPKLGNLGRCLSEAVACFCLFTPGSAAAKSGPPLHPGLFFVVPSGLKEAEKVISILLTISAVVFLATLIRSAFGFGEALVAVPLLALMIPLRVAAPLAVLVSVTVAAVILVQDRSDVHVRSAGWLVAATMLGIPGGVLLLSMGHASAIKLCLGVLIIAFSLYSLLGRMPLELKHDHRGGLLLCGFTAGVLGGAYGMNGPPLVIYGAMRRWSAAQFRATLQAYFLPASLVGLAGFWWAGILTHAVLHDYLISLPAVMCAIPLGRILHRRMRAESFLRWIHGGLVAVGLVLIAQALHAF